MQNAHKIVVRTPNGRIPLRGSGHRWEINREMNLNDRGREATIWIQLVLTSNRVTGCFGLVNGLPSSTIG